MTQTKTVTSNSTGNSSSNKGKTIIAVAGAMIVLLSGYIFYSKGQNNKNTHQLQAQLDSMKVGKYALQQQFGAASIKLEAVANMNMKLGDTLDGMNQQIQQLKTEVVAILNDKNATGEQLKKAKNILDEMDAKVDDFMGEVGKLEAKNKRLMVNYAQASSGKAETQDSLLKLLKEKERIEDIASTMRISNINIVPINQKESGKEKSTSVAKKVNLLRVSFDMEENRIAASGKKTLFVRIATPDGKVLTNGSSMPTREEGNKQYTSKLTVNYKQGKRVPVSFDWKPSSDAKYQAGAYKIDIYQNGYKIGTGSKNLKKGGLFS